MNPCISPTPNFDNLLLQSLMSKLEIQRPSSANLPPPLLSDQSLEDLLSHLADASVEDFDNEDDSSSSSPSSFQAQLSKEESNLEKEIIRTILSGKTEILKPNSGQAVAVGQHHICVGFHEDSSSDYRVWEWHGHIMLFDEEMDYKLEYIYGNYFERVNGNSNAAMAKKKAAAAKEEAVDDEADDENVGNLGLKELIDAGESKSTRVLHRHLNAGSSRCVQIQILKKKPFFFSCS